MASVQAAFVLDHDLVLDGAGLSDRRWYVLPRSRMGLGMAVEGLLSPGNLFGSVTRRFAAASVLLAVVASIAPARDLFRDWRRYQRQYLRLVHGRPDGAQLERRFSGGIQQIWIPELQVVDRCTS